MQASTFNAIFDDIANTIEYKHEWENGTGYFDGAVYSVALNPGERAKALTPWKRRIVFVGTRYGTCVFFERYMPEEGATDIRVVSNVPQRAVGLVTDGLLSTEDFYKFTNGSLNIGHIIERIAVPSKYYAEREAEFAAAVQARASEAK